MTQPAVQAPVGTVLRIRSDKKLPETMWLEILTDDGSVVLANVAAYGDDTDEEVRQAFSELVHEYETEQSVIRRIARREGEYDQWPPQ